MKLAPSAPRASRGAIEDRRALMDYHAFSDSESSTAEIVCYCARKRNASAIAYQCHLSSMEIRCAYKT